MAVQVKAQRGGEWTLSSPAAAEVFTPEDLDESQRQVGQTVREFVRGEVGGVVVVAHARFLCDA